MGMTEIDNILMLVAVSTRMTELERDVVISLIMEGFKDAATEAGTSVTGGDTVVNPWLTIGGVATSVCTRNEYIMPENAEVGDVLILTKPLGTQVVVNAHSWMESHPDLWNKINNVVSEDDVRKAYDQAVKSMSRLNRTAARIMHLCNAHAATDVTGFGILGHAENLANFQKNEVSFYITELPVIAKSAIIDETCDNRFHLLQGRSPESSGGLLICLPREQAGHFCKEMDREEGQQAWIVGFVGKGNRSARLVENTVVLEVSP